MSAAMASTGGVVGIYIYIYMYIHLGRGRRGGVKQHVGGLEVAVGVAERMEVGHAWWGRGCG